ncbi:hypothetical protein [Cellulomonas sp. NPDC089187]|uniref:hypothetical protein n=1 Tax=Cellulomonas sp. NPDC089187 TaxID=3154970 RepID=UPI00341DE7C7
MTSEGWWSTCCGLVAVVAGVTGAVTDAPAADSGPPVVVSGSPLVHPFHPGEPEEDGRLVEMVTGSWHVAAQGAQEVPFDGTLIPYGVVNPALAEDLVVEYGVPRADGTVVWHRAGTLDHARSYAQTLGTRPMVGVGGAELDIPVRVLFEEHPEHGPIPPGADVTVAFVVGTRQDMLRPLAAPA